MFAPNYFIVKPVDGRRYNNIRNYGGVEFIISTSQEDHTVSNRFAEVVSLPRYYVGDVNVGDIVVVHHNVFKFYYDMKGNQKSSWHHLFDDYFILEEAQLYLYKNSDDKWIAPSPYCFVRPIKSEEKVINTLGKHEELWGELVFKNGNMSNVSEGDIVSFTPDSEYEFDIDGEILYRMYDRNICLKR